MPKNAKPIDFKPQNERIIDWKPSNSFIVNTKSKNDTLSVSQTTDQLYTVILGRGMWLGFNALTYPNSITITSSKSP